MPLTRRQFIASTAAATALAPIPGWAANTLQMGDIRIDTLSDGHLVLPTRFALGNRSAEEAAPILARHGITGPQLEPPCNVTLVRDGTNTVLFDVGAGPDFMSSAGRLMDAFDALDLSPEDVTHVVFTHAHPDHIGGLLDDFDDLMFYDAEHMIGAEEFDYWANPDTVNTIQTERQTMAVGAKRRLDVLADNITTFSDGQEILPGIVARATFGHTPGHMAFQVGEAMIVGDAIVNHHLAFERPGWLAGSDQDPETGAATRMALLDQLAHEKQTLIGFHLPGGGIGRVEKTADAYRFVTEDI